MPSSMRRHAEGERDLAGGSVAGLEEVHVLRRQRHGFPVEAAFEQEWPAGVAGALEPLLQFALQALVLFGRQVAVTRGVDERARGPGRVVEQRLVPARRRCCGGRSRWRRPRSGSCRSGRWRDGRACMCRIGRTPGAHLAGDAHRAAADGVVVGLGPAVGAGDHLHAVGTEHVQLANPVVRSPRPRDRRCRRPRGSRGSSRPGRAVPLGVGTAE